MHRPVRILALAGTLAAAAVVATPEVASAAVNVTRSGTVVTVNATGDVSIEFTCESGSFAAAGVVASPAIACGAVTEVDVNGDAGPQSVSGEQLNKAVFAGNPFLEAVLGDGADRLTETDRADGIDMGPGSDTIFLDTGGFNNGTTTMGTGSNDVAYVDGTEGPDSITATSTNADVTTFVETNDGGSARTIKNVDSLSLRGLGGPDTIDANGVTAASGIGSVAMLGGEGNDDLRAGVKPSSMYGLEGTNTMTGGPATDFFISYSETDTINAFGAGSDQLYDMFNGRSGGRTVNGTSLNTYQQIQDKCDVQSRVRSISGQPTVVSSLCRPGIQTLPADLGVMVLDFRDDVDNKGLADVVVPGDQNVNVSGDSFTDDLIDVTVPSGTWTTSVAVNGAVTVNTSDPALGDVIYNNIDDATVHGPWADKNQSFAHRVIRDLLYRFPSSGEREGIRTSLANGTKTRAQVVAATMNTDEYRGLDVDRVFVRFLGRVPDPGGRTYWINALRGGRSLQKFRAQLFGSNEYFVKKGGSTTTGFVRSAYFDVLGRLPDPSGEAYWVNKINSGTGRGSVANAFLASTEARRAIVKDQFQRFALRLPTTTESQQWVASLGQPTGEIDLIAFLAASSAYLNAG